MSGFTGKDKFHNFKLRSIDSKVLESAESLVKELNLKNNKLKEKTNFIANLLLNLKLSSRYNRPLVIPRGKTYYDGVPKKNRSDFQTHKIVTQVLDALVVKEYLEKRDAIPKIRATGYTAKARILNLLNNIQYKDIIISRPKYCIIKRKIINGRKKEVTYLPDKTSESLEQDMKLFNDLRENVELSFGKLPSSLFDANKFEIQEYAVEDINTLRPVKDEYNIKLKTTYLVRIFYDNFNKSGRFYRGLEQTIKKELRAFIYINGNPTVELDYKAMHPRILYNKRENDPAKSFDPYAAKHPVTSKDLRDVYKQLFLIMINAKDEKGALAAFRKKVYSYKATMDRDFIYEDDDTYDYDNLVKVIGGDTEDIRKQLFDDLVSHNSQIKDDLFTEKCHTLMNDDSYLANEILKHFAVKGILVLCVHDSFIIEEEHVDELQKVMKNVYKAKFKYSPVIEKK